MDDWPAFAVVVDAFLDYGSEFRARGGSHLA